MAYSFGETCLSDSAIIFAIVITVVVLFIWGRLPVMLVALMVPLALFFSGILPLEQVFAGFGSPVVIFIASLFIVAAGLEASGIAAWVCQWLSRAVGDSPLRLSLLTMLIVALLSPLVSQSGAVAALMPVAMLMSLRLREAPSRFLMPLAFTSAAGSLLALTGTAKNVLVSNAAAGAGYGEFGFFEFAWVGIPLLAGTLLIVTLAGRKLLPDRRPATLPGDFGQHAETLTTQYGVAGSARVFTLDAASPLVGQPHDAARGTPGVSLLSVSGAGGNFAAGDALVLSGSAEALEAFTAHHALVARDEAETSVAEMLFNRNSGLAEVVVKPRSKLIGQTLLPGMVTESGRFVVVAVQRQGEPIGGEGAAVPLQAGDHLLIQGSWAALKTVTTDPDVLVVDRPDEVRRQAVPLGPGSGVMLAILAAMVLVLALGLLPASVGVLLAAMAVIGAGILTVPQAYRAIDWNTVVLVGSMLPLATAMYVTGVATKIADQLVAATGGGSPALLLAGLFVFTALLGQVISNTATTMIIIPIAVTAAGELGISVKPVLMSLNVGASAAFLTPVATTSNLIVMGPGGYRFGDYWKLGAAMMVLYFAVAVFWVPLVWRF